MTTHSFLLLNTRLFRDPVEEILCTTPVEILPCLDKIEHFRKAGFFIAGFISYEAYTAFLNIPTPHTNASIPLLRFGVFATCDQLTAEEIHVLLTTDKIDTVISHLQFNLSKKKYLENITCIQHYLHQGHTYQVNYTGKYHFQFQGSPRQLYRLLCLRQPVDYGALLYYPE